MAYSNNKSSNNKRLLKNTILLYLRTFVVMLISLYTTRLVLKELGVTDYGIYNVVAGFVTMFSFISGALSLAISRFITYELGRGNLFSVQKVFSASIVVQFFLCLIVLLIGEIVGIWFLNEKMIIPADRLSAANWVFHCSILSFCINLVSVPYNALITAYEKMNVFAFISILEASMKLLICYVLLLPIMDKLILYAFLLMIVSLTIRIIYGIYCNRSFVESKFTSSFDRKDIISIGKFAGWTFISNGAAILNTQGVNVLTNLYFSVTYNAARGMATQAESAIKQFVSSFTTSINPQIIKKYAEDRKEDLFKLICRGAKFSYFLFMLISLPLIFEAEMILKIWLSEIPEKTIIFFKLAIVCAMIDVLGNSGTTACHATGKMKLYVLSISSLSILVFPLTFFAYSRGLSVESSYYIFIIIYILILFVRLIVMKKLLEFPIMLFITDVLRQVVLCSILAICCPYLIGCIMDSSVLRLCTTIIFSTIGSSVFIFMIGCDKQEKAAIIGLFIHRLNKIRNVHN